MGATRRRSVARTATRKPLAIVSGRDPVSRAWTGCGNSDQADLTGAAVAKPAVASQMMAIAARLLSPAARAQRPRFAFVGALFTLLIRSPDESILRCEPIGVKQMALFDNTTIIVRTDDEST